MDLATELTFALRLADEADAITLPAFTQRDFSVGWKSDRSEVTDVDRSCEAAIAERILAERPAHGIVGEEHGTQGADGPLRWIVDPIDGTSGFARGIPVWGTLIALCDGDDVLVAVVSAPALGRRWTATRGGGAAVDGRRATVSDVASLGEAQVSVTLNAGWERLGLIPALNAIALEARRARALGDFWQHVLVAEGALDVAIDAIGVALYDVAAVRLLVEEAGGRFSDREGRATHAGGSAISTNGLLHDEVIRRLRTPGTTR